MCRIVNERENTVILKESVVFAESVVRGVMDKFEKGQVSGDLSYIRKRVGLYLGDLKWISEFWTTYDDQRRNYYRVEHIIMLKRLMSGTKESGKLFLVGIATFRTYMKGKTCHPSLESIWQLYPLIISADSLTLSLSLENRKKADSSKDNERKRSNNLGSGDVLQRFEEALNENPHKVFFVEDIEYIDYCCLKRLSKQSKAEMCQFWMVLWLLLRTPLSFSVAKVLVRCRELVLRG
ncbi:hypothetical protein GQ457_02G018870 [Hibiscus cannabinus]